MPKHAFPAAGGALPANRPTVFLAITPGLRARLATTIENLIDLLDGIDGDPNLEPEPDEDSDAGIADMASLMEITQ